MDSIEKLSTKSLIAAEGTQLIVYTNWLGWPYEIGKSLADFYI